MTPPDQDSLEGSLLCILYEKANGRNHFSSLEQVGANFRPPVALDRIRIGLDALIEHGVAEPDSTENGSYKITRKGLAWVEGEFAIGFDGHNHQFRRRKSPRPLPNNMESRGPIDWTKWGTVFGALGIIVTIIIAWVA